MPLVSIRLPDDLETRLNLEAERTHRAKSEVARDAIAEYLKRQDRERFLTDIAKAARARGDDEALAMAAEALPLDNESLRLTDGSVGHSVQEPKARYGAPRKKR